MSCVKSQVVSLRNGRSFEEVKAMYFSILLDAHEPAMLN